jgi:sulfofructose kinase
LRPYVVCVGLATLDTIVAVPRHPGPDDRVVASELAVAGGGPAANAAVTLARLGISTYFVGVIGDDDVGDAIRDGLGRERVDISELSVVPGARSPQSVILVGAGGRSISAYAGTVPPLELGERARELCAGAAWVHADHVGYAAARGSGRLSVDASNPVDGLDLRDVALYGPTESSLRGVPEQALDEGAELVVVTRGERGAAAYTNDGTIEIEAPRVDAVSTLGAGDVFHGALLAALVRELPLRDALAFANDCAARSCLALDGRSAIPTEIPA